MRALNWWQLLHHGCFIYALWKSGFPRCFFWGNHENKVRKLPFFEAEKRHQTEMEKHQPKPPNCWVPCQVSGVYSTIVWKYPSHWGFLLFLLAKCFFGLAKKARERRTVGKNWDVFVSFCVTPLCHDFCRCVLNYPILQGIKEGRHMATYCCMTCTKLVI